VNGWEDMGRRQRRGFNRVFLPLMLFACLLLVVVAKVSPEQDTYTSNADAPLVTRTLVPRETTTTARVTTTRATPTTTLPVYTVELDTITIIDGDHVLRLPRTSNVMLYLWLASYAYR